MQESERRQRELLKSMTPEQVIDSHLIAQLVAGDWAIEAGKKWEAAAQAVAVANRHVHGRKLAESLLPDEGLCITKNELVDLSPVVVFLEEEKELAIEAADVDRAAGLRTMVILLKNSLMRMAAVETKLNKLTKEEVRDGTDKR